MAKKKRKQNPRSTDSKAPKKTSAKKPVTILAIGVAAALAVALYMASGGTGPSTSPVDPSLLFEASVGGHVRGPENPAITLTEYGDFECPTCAEFHYIVRDLMQRLPDEIELKFHHYPLPVGPNSVTASLAAEAAGEQGRYWEMHDALFETQSQWTGREDAIAIFTSMAGQLGLDTDRFVADLQAPDIQSRVVRDRQQGAMLGVSGTPTFFVDGQRLDFLPQGVDEFQAIIRSVMVQ